LKHRNPRAKRLFALAQDIFALPAPFRDRLLHLLLIWHSLPQRARDDVTRRLTALAKAPNQTDEGYKKLLTQLDRIVRKLERSRRKP
jgi:hypothetical protein